jgi:hypothetical protein
MTVAKSLDEYPRIDGVMAMPKYNLKSGILTISKRLSNGFSISSNGVK